jgi:hypothetical protein
MNSREVAFNELALKGERCGGDEYFLSVNKGRN